MPLIGRSNYQSSNVVRNPVTLPYPLYKGSVSYSDRFNEAPSATILYEGVRAVDIGALEAAYPLKGRVNFYGVPLEVAGTQQSLQRAIVLDDALVEVFTFQVALAYPAIATLLTKEKESELIERAELIGQLAYSDGLQPKALEAGNLWRFSRREILEIGQTRLGLPSEGYRDATLSWTNSETDPNAVPTPAQPKIEVIEEGSERLTQPPDYSNYLKDTSSNHDESGPTKFYKRSTRVDGTPDQEYQEVWGFAYLMRDIAINGGDQLYSDTPGQFWQSIEERNTTYIYTEVRNARLEVEIRDPSLGAVAEGRKLPVVVHPDFEKYVTLGIGDRITVKTRNLFLTEVVTTGRKLLRLLKETETDNSLDPTAPRAELYEFRWVPFYERSSYLLKALPEEFGGNTALPFRVEFQAYADLDWRLKLQVSPSDATGDGKIAVLYPDPAFVEPFYVASESTQANSFAWAPDPDGEIQEREPPLPPAPPPHFMTGQESENTVTRKIVDPASQRWSEFTRGYSSQDPQFVAVAESAEYAEKVGSLPTPQVRQPKFEEGSISPTGTIAGGAGGWQYRVTTPDISDRIRPGGSVEIAGAKNADEALAGLKVRLRISNMNSSQGQFRLAWHYPNLKPGDRLDIEGYRHAGKGVWRVMDLSWVHKYDGSNNPIGSPLITSEGMELTLGLDADRPLAVQVRRDKGSGPTVSARLIAAQNEIGQVLPPLPSRRNF